ncbi:MAG: RDD family protein [Acidimicrobiia bacterium]|nr:RDD family protein [Acidimicrobiia bacterium]
MMEPIPDQPENRIDLDLAPPGARMGARAIDTLIGIGVYVTISLILVSSGNIEIINEEAIYSDTARSALLWIPPLVWGLYEVLMILNRGQTLGKIVTKIKVITVDGEEPPPIRHALFRWGVLAIPTILIPTLGLFIAFAFGIWFLFDSNRQGLHDKAASTYVVKVEPADS